MSGAAARWTRALAAWAIPQDILDQAPESPWGFPVEAFAARQSRELTPSHRRALDALPAGGTVLDVGAGGGAMSRPLRSRAGRVVAVDSQSSMLDAVDADVKVLGSWPDVAGEVEPADVVVCGHVTYNVADLVPFVRALDHAARRRVVVEMTERHPLVAMAPLWRRFWGIDRPSGPSFRECVEVIREAGVEPEVEEWESSSGSVSFTSLDDLVAFTRRRLCLPPSRDDEVREALVEEGAARVEGRWVPSRSPRRLLTIWWDGAAPDGPDRGE